MQPRFAPNQTNAPALVQICRLLDGLPLGLELAAAQVAVLAPPEIAARSRALSESRYCWSIPVVRAPVFGY